MWHIPQPIRNGVIFGVRLSINLSSIVSRYAPVCHLYGICVEIEQSNQNYLRPERLSGHSEFREKLFV